MSNLSSTRQSLGLVGWCLLLLVIAILGAVASINAGAFYQSLEQPAWAPPATWFGPVWSTIYTLMAIAAWLVWRPSGFGGAPIALAVFIGQLVPNVLWSWFFFVWHLGALSFANILILWGLIVVTLIGFWRANRIAGLLLVPYLLWVTLAVALNYSVWQLNPAMLG
ncbi:TspO/MBR family protein [Salicola sp. Rm-C-2C1-2]|uniref:TspO/MBR family protein n=1 Tax=Salicola sp. Rm-C-2C1-2 TaxID=3141321 RepID=UPI0032E4B0F8